MWTDGRTSDRDNPYNPRPSVKREGRLVEGENNLVQHMRDVASDWPVQVIIVQSGKLVKQFDARPGNHKVSDVSRRLSTKRNKRDRFDNDSFRHTSNASNSSCQKEGIEKNLIYIDTSEPFTVVLHRHQKCTRLAGGFWHTETLNGRPRMGNVLDRSRLSEEKMTEADELRLPRLSRNCDPASLSMARSRSDNTYDRSLDFSDNVWIPCGHLRQKVDQPTGRYSLRLSPSMRPSKEDHVLDLWYHDSKIRSEPAEAPKSPEHKLNRQIETPVLRRHKRPASSMEDYPDFDLRPSQAVTTSPVAFSISKLSLRSSPIGWSAKSRGDRHDYASALEMPQKKAVSHKRKLINGSADILRGSKRRSNWAHSSLHAIGQS